MENNIVYLVWYKRRADERWALWGVYGNEERANEVLNKVHTEFGYEAHINKENVWE